MLTALETPHNGYIVRQALGNICSVERSSKLWAALDAEVARRGIHTDGIRAAQTRLEKYLLKEQPRYSRLYFL